MTLFTGDTIEPTTQSALLETSYFGQRPTGSVGESFPRNGTALTATALTTANATYTVLPLTKGTVVANLTFWSGSQAGATLTHQLAGLADASFNLLATSADATSAAWAANASKTFAMTAAYTVPADGLYYAILAIAASTVPSIVGVATIAVVADATPPVAFTDSAHTISTALPATGTNSAGINPLYVTAS